MCCWGCAAAFCVRISRTLFHRLLDTETDPSIGGSVERGRHWLCKWFDGAKYSVRWAKAFAMQSPVGVPKLWSAWFNSIPLPLAAFCLLSVLFEPFQALRRENVRAFIAFTLFCKPAAETREEKDEVGRFGGSPDACRLSLFIYFHASANARFSDKVDEVIHLIEQKLGSLGSFFHWCFSAPGHTAVLGCALGWASLWNRPCLIDASLCAGCLWISLCSFLHAAAGEYDPELVCFRFVQQHCIFTVS